MNTLTRKIWEALRKERLIHRRERIVLAVSGGPDSLALMLALAEVAPALDLELIVAHLDHGLQPDSVETAAYVIEMGGKVHLPVEIGCADLSRRPGGKNLEEAAREARYTFLADVAALHGAGAIAVGHTADDQSETLLMRLMRGAGPRGLAAMTPLTPTPPIEETRAQETVAAREEAGIRVIRPLLGVERSLVSDYLSDRNVIPRIDWSNQDDTITRNRVRRHLVPLMRRRFNPGIVETLGRTADLMGEIDRYLKRQAVEALAGGVSVTGAAGDDQDLTTQGVVPWEDAPGSGKVELDLPQMASYDRVLQRYIVRVAIERLRGDLRGIGYQHIDAVLALCRPRATGGCVELPGGMVALRDRRRLSLWRRRPTPAPPLRAIEVPVPGTVEIADTGMLVSAEVVEPGRARAHHNKDPLRAWFDQAKVELPLRVRARRPGDRMQPLGLAATKKVKDLLIDAGIPRRRRGAVPILEDRRGILWIVGVRRSAHALVGENTQRALEVRLSSPT